MNQLSLLPLIVQTTQRKCSPYRSLHNCLARGIPTSRRSGSNTLPWWSSGSLASPSILHSVGNKICVPNTRCGPVNLRNHEHLCQVRQVYVPKTEAAAAMTINTGGKKQLQKQCWGNHDILIISHNKPWWHSRYGTRQSYQRLRQETIWFSPVSDRYNGNAGSFEAPVNIDLPCPNRGRVGCLNILATN